MIERGTLALCGLGTLGLITSDSPEMIKYPDGNEGMAWLGIHLTDAIAPVGSPWSSRDPVEIIHVSDLLALKDLDQAKRVR